jgi:hypothetical protein
VFLQFFVRRSLSHALNFHGPDASNSRLPLLSRWPYRHGDLTIKTILNSGFLLKPTHFVFIRFMRSHEKSVTPHSAPPVLNFKPCNKVSASAAHAPHIALCYSLSSLNKWSSLNTIGILI